MKQEKNCRVIRRYTKSGTICKTKSKWLGFVGNEVKCDIDLMKYGDDEK